MAGFYELVKRNIAPYYSVYVIFLLVVIFTVAGYYAYNEYKPKDSSVLDKIHQPSENVDEETPKEEEKPKLALSVPQIVGICLLIILGFILVYAFFPNSSSSVSSSPSSGGILKNASTRDSVIKLFVGLGLFGIGMYVFRTLFYNKPTPEPWAKKYRENEFGPKIKPGKTLNVYFFTADWCPHCRNAKPEIDKFETEYNNKDINGKQIMVYRVDCTDSEETTVAKQINDFGVTSYPTVKIKDSDGNTFEFDAKITNENLVGFVESVANN
jgi:thiol-disulfide isomerase/thioredoxin